MTTTHHLLGSVSTLGALALLAAGCSGGSKSAPVAYTYDPDAAQVVVGSLNTARNEHQMTVLDPSAGELLVTGGYTFNGPTNTAEIIDASTGQSRPVAALMTTPRAEHVAARRGGEEVFLFGGVDASGAPLASVEVYSAQDDRFSALGATLLEPRVGAAISVEGDRAVIAGGGDPAADSVEIWSLSQRQRVGEFTGLAGTKREDVQLVQVAADLYFLYGGLSGQPNLWINLTDGSATPAEGEVRYGGTAFFANFEPGAALVVGGFDSRNKFQRGIQVVRPSHGAGDLEVYPFGLFRERVRPLALGSDEGLYFLGGASSVPGDPVERVGFDGAELFPELFGAPRNMEALYLGVDHIVSSGGAGPDGEPLALVNVLVPNADNGDGIFQANQVRQQLSNQLDQDIVTAQVQLLTNQADLASTTATLAQLQSDLQSEIARGQSLQAAIDAANQRIQQLQGEIQTLQGQIPGLQAQVAQLQNQGQQSAAQLQQAQQQLGSAQNQLSNAQQQLAQANGQVSSLQGQLSTTNGRINSLRGQINTASAAPAAPTSVNRGPGVATGAPTSSVGHGPPVSLFRPNGPYFGPGSAPNVPFNMAYARDAQGRTFVAIITRNGSTLVYSRDATRADRVPAHMIAQVTVKPR